MVHNMISFVVRKVLSGMFQVVMIVCGCSTYWDVAAVAGLLLGRMANLGLGES